MRGREKRIRAVCLAALLAAGLLLCACGDAAAPPAAPAPTEAPGPLPSLLPSDGTGVPDESGPADGRFPVAMVVEGGTLRDGGPVQSLWRGVKSWAFSQGLAYRYYIPQKGRDAGEEERLAAMSAAAEAGAEIVFCTGAAVGPALTRAACSYPEVMWVYVDGAALSGPNGEPLQNCAGIGFDPLAIGYLAGYAAVAEGFRSLGFSGAGAGRDESCCLCGFGFVQGASAAAVELGVQAELRYTWLCGGAYGASPALEELLEGWYGAGTELVLSCGGTLYQSAAAAAETCGGRFIALDNDKSELSDRLLFSVIKNYDAAALRVLGQYQAGRWAELGGRTTVLGAGDGAIALVSADGAGEAAARSLLTAMAQGSVSLDGSYPEASGQTVADRSFPGLSLSYLG